LIELKISEINNTYSALFNLCLTQSQQEHFAIDIDLFHNNMTVVGSHFVNTL